MSISEYKSSDPSPLYDSYSIGPMMERDLNEVCDIEEIAGLNRWGYDAYYREIFTNPNSVMLVARNLLHGPRVIGFFAGWVVEDELHVNNIATHPDFRRIGIGARLMDAAIDEAKLRGVKYVLLEVRASNEIAQLLYRRLGFSFVARRRDYYRTPTEDALVMKLQLK